MSHLDLTYTFEQDVNRVLEFFSCPMPGFALLSEREQRRQMHEMVKPGNGREASAMLAHCSSVKELQYVASLYKKR